MFCWVLWVGSALAGQAEELVAEQPTDAHVYDAALVLPLAEASQLEQQAHALEQEFGVWVQFVTVPLVEEGNALDLGLSLFESLGLNQSAEQNDVLVLIVSQPPKIEVVVGIGLRPVLSNAWEKVLMETYVYPEVERGQGASALVRWMHKVDQRIRLLGADARAGATAPGFGLVPPPPKPDYSLIYWGIGALLFSSGLGALSFALVQRRFCFNHPVPLPMFHLSEMEDDQHLTARQRAREGIEPLLHDVLRCPACGQTRVISREVQGMN